MFKMIRLKSKPENFKKLTLENRNCFWNWRYWIMVDINKLNKILKQFRRTGVLVGPRASKGSYGELAMTLAEKWFNKKREKRRQGMPDRSRKTPKKPTPKGTRSFGGRRGIGIAVKGGGRIL